MPSDIPSSPDDRDRHEEERQPLAAQILSIKEARALSWEAMGRETGIAYQTLQAWAAGKYAGRIDTVSEKVRRYFDSLTQRQAMAPATLAEPGFVQTPTSAAFHALFAQAQYMPTIVTVVGAPGTGKTQSAEAYAEAGTNVWMVTALAGHPSGRWLLEELGRVMRLTERGGSQRLASVIIDQLRGRRALIIVDEANHLASPTLDLLRGIHDQAKCGIALVGNSKVISRLEGTRDADFAQLSRRRGGRINVSKPNRQDADLVLQAWGVTDEAVARLLRTIAARPGALGTMTMTLKLAHMLAAGKGEAMGAEHIQRADAQLQGRDEAA